MIKSKRIIKILSYILIVAESAVLTFSNPFTLHAFATGEDETEETSQDTEATTDVSDDQDEVTSEYDFVEGRYIREDGQVYMKVFYVDKKGATIDFYDTDLEIVWWDDYQPVEEQRVFEERFNLTKLKKANQISGYKKNINQYSKGKKDGSIDVFISEDNKKIHIDDTRKDKSVVLTDETEEERDFSGDYIWQPFVSGHTSILEIPMVGCETFTKTWTIPGGFIQEIERGTYWRLKYKNVPVEDTIKYTVKDPDTYVHEKIKWKETETGVSVEEIAACMYTHFNCKAVVTKAEVLDDKQFRQYHLYDRLPSNDGQFCADKADEDAVVKARKSLLEATVGTEATSCEMVFYQDTDARKHFSGIYVENGVEYSTEIPLSQGDLTMFYGLADIDWYDNNINNTYGYIVDEASGTIRLVGVAYNVITNTGGIANKIIYDITMYLNSDGVVDLVGTIECYGLGSEHVVYTVFGNADEFLMNKDIQCNWYFKESWGEYDIVTIIPGEEHEYEEKRRYTKKVPYFEEVNWERVTEIPQPDITVTETTQILYYYYLYITEHHIHIGNWPTEGYVAPEEIDIIVSDNPTDSDNPEEEQKPDDSNVNPDDANTNPDEGNTDGEDNTDNDEKEKDNETDAGKISEENKNGLPEEFSQKERFSEYIPAYSSSNIAKIAASSSLWNQSASNLIDGKLNTCWSEGVSGTGIGEEIIVVFDGEKTLGGMGIANGCFASNKAYRESGRATKIKLTFSDGKSESFELSTEDMDIENLQMSDYLIFSETHDSNYVRITIEDAVAGSKYEDTCISELYFD